MNSPVWFSSLQQRWYQIVGPLSSRDLWATLWGSLGQALLLFSYFLIRPYSRVHGGSRPGWLKPPLLSDLSHAAGCDAVMGNAGSGLLEAITAGRAHDR